MAEINKEKLKQNIKDILKDADLSTLSGKKVRKMLEEKYDTDLSDRKKDVDDMVMELLDEMQKSEKSETEDGSSDDDEEPPKKKPKSTKNAASDESDDDSDVDDEEMAKKLQQKMNDENKRTRKGKAQPKSAGKKKEKVEKEKTSTKKPPKDCFLSPKLAAVVGGEKMPRSEVVKRMWEIIKERKLQDPKQKNFMICDDELYDLFGRKRLKAFGMMKYLTTHIFRTQAEFDKVYY